MAQQGRRDRLLPHCVGLLYTECQAVKTGVICSSHRHLGTMRAAGYWAYCPSWRKTSGRPPTMLLLQSNWGKTGACVCLLWKCVVRITHWLENNTIQSQSMRSILRLYSGVIFIELYAIDLVSPQVAVCADSAVTLPSPHQLPRFSLRRKTSCWAYFVYTNYKSAKLPI